MSELLDNQVDTQNGGVHASPRRGRDEELEERKDDCHAKNF